jgi:predicted kinase
LARLIVLSGLPGSGKSTLAKGLSDLSGAILLRVDVFEQDLRNVNSSDFDVGAQGYQIGYEHARRHLLEGKDVIADAVNAGKQARASSRSKLCVRMKTKPP